MSEDRGADPRTGHRPDEQQEPVHAPYRGGSAPKRSASTVVWLIIGVAVVFALGIALVVAAIRAA